MRLKSDHMYLGCEIKRVGEVGFLYPEVYYFVLGALQRMENVRLRVV